MALAAHAVNLPAIPLAARTGDLPAVAVAVAIAVANPHYNHHRVDIFVK
jgi:hypothetical protein